MDRLRFDWDPRKASANRAKHGVTFEEALSVFADEAALLIPDRITPTTRSASSCSG